MKSLIIIPARMESNRFPGKPLAEAGGKPLLRWTWEQAKRTHADHVVVTSPDREICRYCRDVGGEIWIPSAPDHPTSTHRCAEVLCHLKIQHDVVINWPVGEPLVPVEYVNRMISLFEVEGGITEIGTLVSPLPPEEADNPNTIKVVVSINSVCHWFSRAPMVGAMAHTGIYCFSRKNLLAAGQIDPTALSQAESLEQLAWIEEGAELYGVQMPEFPLSINTPLDFLKFKQIVGNSDG